MKTQKGITTLQQTQHTKNNWLLNKIILLHTTQHNTFFCIYYYYFFCAQSILNKSQKNEISIFTMTICFKKKLKKLLKINRPKINNLLRNKIGKKKEASYHIVKKYISRSSSSGGEAS